MKYKKVVKGVFLERPNRFIANVLVDGEETIVHVKNTGRCKELLVLGAPVYLEDCKGTGDLRKTRYDLIAVKKKSRLDAVLINMDSQAPNRVAEEAFQEGKMTLPGFSGAPQVVRREVTYKKSRFDLYLEGEAPSWDSVNQEDTVVKKKAYVEVKGVTLEKEGVALFPDAPTERGLKHIRELMRAREEGYEAAILFIIQMEQVKYFQPNDQTQPEFGQALREAQEAGVSILAYSCKVEKDSLQLGQPVEVRLEPQEPEFPWLP